jgi:hypothetical protein
MIENSTVFVLGAGASWHYGYPTGGDLVREVISMARRMAQYGQLRLESGQVVQVVPDYVSQSYDERNGVSGAVHAWKLVKEECLRLADRLQIVQPL